MPFTCFSNSLKIKEIIKKISPFFGSGKKNICNIVKNLTFINF